MHTLLKVNYVSMRCTYTCTAYRSSVTCIQTAAMRYNVNTWYKELGVDSIICVASILARITFLPNGFTMIDAAWHRYFTIYLISTVSSAWVSTYCALLRIYRQLVVWHGKCTYLRYASFCRRSRRDETVSSFADCNPYACPYRDELCSAVQCSAGSISTMTQVHNDFRA